MTTHTRQSMDFFRPAKPSAKKPIKITSSEHTVAFSEKKPASSSARVIRPSQKSTLSRSMVPSIPTRSTKISRSQSTPISRSLPDPDTTSPRSSHRKFPSLSVPKLVSGKSSKSSTKSPKDAPEKSSEKSLSPKPVVFLDSVTVEKRPLGDISSAKAHPEPIEQPTIDAPRRTHAPDPVRTAEDLSEKKPLSTVFILFLTVVLGIIAGIAVYYFVSRS